MKKSALPISSPGRVEKYPPPLMRFLMNSGGSRSRSRSRTRGVGTSSPMFVRKKNTNSETQEPSSPKVTCMGQVRVRRPTNRGTTGVPVRRRCLWIRAALFCHYKINREYSAIWRKCASFFKTSFRRNSEIRDDSIKGDTKFENKFEVSEQEGGENGEEDEAAKVMAKEVALSPSSPPNNALLLTRCRSAPYRSSSLAGRFWSSPLRNSETREEREENRETQAPSESPTHRKELYPDEEESSGDPKSGAAERIIKSRGEEEKVREESAHPLILRRCKSEPARTAGKPVPEMNRWRKRKAILKKQSKKNPNNLRLSTDSYALG